MSTFIERGTEPPGPLAGSPAPSLRSIDAVVLGGAHWRASALESIVPRPLLPVAQQPLLFYVLQWLGDADVRTITVCTTGLSGGACRDLAPHARLSNVEFREDRTPRGPAGCARDAVSQTASDQILIVEGSVIPVLDLPRLLARHTEAGAALTVVVQPAARRRDASAAVPTGIYVFDRQALQTVPASGFQDIKETLIPQLYRSGAVIVTHEAEGSCPRVLDPATYLAVNQWMIGRIAKHGVHRPPFEPVLEHPAGAEVVAHGSARIDPGAVLIGPVLVGPSATIAPGATIIGPSSIGAGTTVRHGAVVSRSVVWDRCVVESRGTVDGAVVMHDARVDAGECVMDTVRPPALPGVLWRTRLSRIRRSVVPARATPLADATALE